MAQSKRQSRITVRKATVEQIVSDLQQLPDRNQHMLIEAAVERLKAAIDSAIKRGCTPESVQDFLAEQGIRVTS